MRKITKFDDNEVVEHWKSVLEVLDLKRICKRWEGPFELPGRVALVFTRSLLIVFADIEDHGKDGNWLHVSVSKKSNRLPDYEDIQEIHRSFIPSDRVAVEIWALSSEHYSLAGVEVRHLWCRLDERTVPDLRCEGGV